MDEDEFLALLAQNELLLYSICISFSKGDAERVRDLYQEIVCNLWSAHGRYRGECSPKNWFYRVALNTAISLQRKERVRPATIPLPEDLELLIIEEQDDPIYEELYMLIEQLPKVDQALLFLYIDGATEEEMAAVLGISPSGIGSRIYRIKKKLIDLKQ